MDNFITGAGGIFLGWLLAQGGFFFQRRISLRAEISKAAYFLIIILGELDFIISTKEGIIGKEQFADDIVKNLHGNLIGQNDFNKEVASMCERVSMVNIQLACDIRSYCILADQAAKGTVAAIRKIDSEAALLSSNMFLDALVFSRYNLEQLVFHLLRICDLKYFIRFCIKIGWKRTKDHALKRKILPKLGVDGLKQTLESSCSVLRKAYETRSDREMNK